LQKQNKFHCSWWFIAYMRKYFIFIFRIDPEASTIGTEKALKSLILKHWFLNKAAFSNTVAIEISTVFVG